ncbi:hypothetical protein [Chitinophaga solisilvae]|nr:hypothetical protein [Chitinophaga solisilvae]
MKMILPARHLARHMQCIMHHSPLQPGNINHTGKSENYRFTINNL